MRLTAVHSRQAKKRLKASYITTRGIAPCNRHDVNFRLQV